MHIFSPDFPDRFSPFSPSHVATMIIIACFWVFVPLKLSKGISKQADKRFRYGMAALLVGQYLGWMVWEVVTGRFSLQLSLPLNLCDITNFLLAVLLVRPGKRLFEVLYFWALAGTIQSYITPNITYAFPHFEFFVFYLQHGGEILVTLYFVFVLKFRPVALSIVKTYAWLLALIAFVYVFNLLTNSNYMFLMADTPHPSTVSRMIALFGPPPRHLIGLSMVSLLSILILYIPWLIVDWRKKKKQGTIPLAAGLEALGKRE